MIGKLFRTVIKWRVVVLVLVLFVVGGGLIAWEVLSASPQDTFQEVQADKDAATYDELLVSSTDIFPGSCREMRGLRGDDSSSEAFKIWSESCKEALQKQFAKWQELFEAAEAPSVVARASFYTGAFYYAGAYNFKNLESAEAAIEMLEASFRHEPGSAKRGYSAFDYERATLIEMARNLYAELKKEKEEEERLKKQQPNPEGEQRQPASVQQDPGGAVVEGEPPGGPPLPIVGEGVKP